MRKTPTIANDSLPHVIGLLVTRKISLNFFMSLSINGVAEHHYQLHRHDNHKQPRC